VSGGRDLDLGGGVRVGHPLELQHQLAAGTRRCGAQRRPEETPEDRRAAAFLVSERVAGNGPTGMRQRQLREGWTQPAVGDGGQWSGPDPTGPSGIQSDTWAWPAELLEVHRAAAVCVVAGPPLANTQPAANHPPQWVGEWPGGRVSYLVGG